MSEEFRGPRRRRWLLRVSGSLGLILLLAASALVGARLYTHEKEDRARDRWQRPEEVIRALDLRHGSVVADVGAGPGYFALKLSPVVGRQGKVTAVDLSRRSLLVLRARALLRTQYNIEYVIGQEDDPRLGTDSVDAILVAYTYHEFTHPAVMLAKLRQALHPGGRLVVLDLSPAKPGAARREQETQNHELSVSFADSEIRRSGFEVVRMEDRFVEQTPEQAWWLIVARKW